MSTDVYVNLCKSAQTHTHTQCKNLYIHIKSLQWSKLFSYNELKRDIHRNKSWY